MANELPQVDATFTCYQGVAKGVGIFAILEFGFFAALSLHDPRSGWQVSAGFGLFILLAGYLYLYSGRITVDRSGITQRCPLGTYFIGWAAITDVWTGSGQLVFSGPEQRLAVPGIVCWTGREKRQVIAAIQNFCNANHITPRERIAAIVMSSKGTRQPVP